MQGNYRKPDAVVYSMRVQLCSSLGFCPHVIFVDLQRVRREGLMKKQTGKLCQPLRRLCWLTKMRCKVISWFSPAPCLPFYVALLGLHIKRLFV